MYHMKYNMLSLSDLFALDLILLYIGFTSRNTFGAIPCPCLYGLVLLATSLLYWHQVSG